MWTPGRLSITLSLTHTPHSHARHDGLHGAHCPYSAQAQAVLAAHGGRCTGCAVCAHRPRNRPPRALRARGAGRRGRGYKGVVEPRGGRGARAELYISLERDIFHRAPPHTPRVLSAPLRSTRVSYYTSICDLVTLSFVDLVLTALLTMTLRLVEESERHSRDTVRVRTERQYMVFSYYQQILIMPTILNKYVRSE